MVALRNESSADDSFLRALYASVRQDELDGCGWPPAQRDAFLAQQFEAQTRTYRSAFSDAQFSIITLKDQPVGRIIVHRAASEIRMVDLALLPEYRNRGIGTQLLRELFAEAGRANKPVRLRVHHGSRAAHLYERLGFQKTDGTGIHDHYEWRVHTAAAKD
jgi:ribosomal protein S18 acetylase RimI-like enzyme